jgi:hypothetical protein
VLRAAVKNDFPVNLSCAGNLDGATALIDRLPRHAIHHRPPGPHAAAHAARPAAALGRAAEAAGPRQAQERGGQGERRLHAVAGTVSLPGHLGPLARVFDAWGFERCLWGTDWTRAFAVVNYENAVEPFRQTKRLSDSERAMLMGGACAKAYGWSPKKGESRSSTNSSPGSAERMVRSSR